MVTFWRTCWFHVKLLVLIVAERGKGTSVARFHVFILGLHQSSFT